MAFAQHCLHRIWNSGFSFHISSRKTRTSIVHICIYVPHARIGIGLATSHQFTHTTQHSTCLCQHNQSIYTALYFKSYFLFSLLYFSLIRPATAITRRFIHSWQKTNFNETKRNIFSWRDFRWNLWDAFTVEYMRCARIRCSYFCPQRFFHFLFFEIVFYHHHHRDCIVRTQCQTNKKMNITIWRQPQSICCDFHISSRYSIYTTRPCRCSLTRIISINLLFVNRMLRSMWWRCSTWRDELTVINCCNYGYAGTHYGQKESSDGKGMGPESECILLSVSFIGTVSRQRYDIRNANVVCFHVENN